jgi:hypothetical protein
MVEGGSHVLEPCRWGKLLKIAGLRARTPTTQASPAAFHVTKTAATSIHHHSCPPDDWFVVLQPAVVFVRRLWEQPIACLAFASQPEAATSERGRASQREASSVSRCECHRKHHFLTETLLLMTRSFSSDRSWEVMSAELA